MACAPAIKRDRTKMPNPTGEKNKVISMASVGISVKLIARRMNCTVEELEQRYEAELKAALPQIKAKVGAHLFAAAQSGNIAAIIFWLKTRELVIQHLMLLRPTQKRGLPRLYLMRSYSLNSRARKSETGSSSSLKSS